MKGHHDNNEKIQNYTQKNYYVVESAEKTICPDCKGEVIRKGNKKRKVLLEDGTPQIFSLKRFYCSKCDKIHTEIPDCIIPYKHYSQETINRVKSGLSDAFSGDDSTIRRWKKQ